MYIRLKSIFMASFSYKYSNINDVNNPLFLTWETGYRNLKVYYGGEIVHHVSTPQELLKGVMFDTLELKNVSVQLMREKPMVIVVKVDGQEYLPENKIAGRGELKGLIQMFWILFALGTIGSILEIKSVASLIDEVSLTILIIIDAVIVLSYGFTAMMLTREKAWSYFIGGSIYIISSLLVVYSALQGGAGVGMLLGLLIRVAIILYIGKFFPVIMQMQKSGRKIETQELLDDF